jgi:NADPH:quinone reductase-like Zn-dependent oxidoreductase
MTDFGGHSELICTPVGSALKIPDRMPFDVAAALPVNYLTAYHILFEAAHVRRGETILIHAAAGGVGLALLQLCRGIGDVRVIGTASASKHGVLRLHGCDSPIDYRTTEYVAEVRRLTQGRGVDVVCDPLGGRDSKRNYSLLRSGGRLISYGFSSLLSGGKRNLFNIAAMLLAGPRFTPLQLLLDDRTVAGVTIASQWGAPLSGTLARLIDLWSDGKIRPVIDSRFPFAKAAEAQRRMEQRRNVGKIVLTPK